jgi:hypothetical protein
VCWLEGYNPPYRIFYIGEQKRKRAPEGAREFVALKRSGRAGFV